MAGTVQIARRLFEHTAFRDEPYTQREAFMWLIMEAAWRPHVRHLCGFAVELQRGELCHSLSFMADQWGEAWDRSRVQRFINKMVGHGMLEKRKISDTTLVALSVCNYDKFQLSLKETDTIPIHPTPENRYTQTQKNDTQESAPTYCDETEIQNSLDLNDTTSEGKAIHQNSVNRYYNKKTKQSSNEDCKHTSTRTRARLPIDWVPSERGLKYALDKKLTNAEIEEMVEDFRTYWSVEKKAAKTQRGWEQTWRNNVQMRLSTILRNRAAMSRAERDQRNEPAGRMQRAIASAMELDEAQQRMDRGEPYAASLPLLRAAGDGRGTPRPDGDVVHGAFGYSEGGFEAGFPEAGSRPFQKSADTRRDHKTGDEGDPARDPEKPSRLRQEGDPDLRRSRGPDHGRGWRE